MPESPSLHLPMLAAEQAQKHVTVNEALRALDAIVQLAVKDRDLAAPPGAPAEGDRYIVAAGASGAWAGNATKLAIWQDGGWTFHAPHEGWRAWVDDENVFLIFNGTAWVDWGAALGAIQNLARLGIGTAADATNPFSAKLNKALWTAKTAAEGGDGDLRYTLNKETAADVLSLLLQRGFSGRAELGLIGDDDLAIKVSADGAAWKEALRIDRSSGRVSLPFGVVQARERLTSDRTYYVRTDCSDGNDGLGDSPGGAFLTIQKAIDTATALDLGVSNVTIQVRSGTYSSATGNVLKNAVGAGTITLIGDAVTPANVVVTTTGAMTGLSGNFFADGVKTRYKIRGFKFTSTATGGVHAINTAANTSLIEFGSGFGWHLYAQDGSYIRTLTGENYTISGGGSRHARTVRGEIRIDSPTVTLIGTPAFSTAFAQAIIGGAIIVTGVAFSGAATGIRYDASTNSVVYTAGGGASYLPGDAAGTTATGGQYT
jgi:hypothetical protein